MKPHELRELARIYCQGQVCCGNPRQAIWDWEDENRPLTDEEYSNVLDAANLMWEESKP